MITENETTHDDLRRALHRVADAAIVAHDAIGKNRPNDQSDAAMDIVRRVFGRAMATHAAMRSSGDAP